MNEPKLLNTSEVAEQLGVTRRRVQALIRDGKLPAQKVGRDWVIRPTDVELVKHRKTGRPRRPISSKDLQAQEITGEQIEAVKITRENLKPDIGKLHVGPAYVAGRKEKNNETK